LRVESDTGGAVGVELEDGSLVYKVAKGLEGLNGSEA